MPCSRSIDSPVNLLYVQARIYDDGLAADTSRGVGSARPGTVHLGDDPVDDLEVSAPDEKRPTVYVIDADPAVRDGLQSLLRQLSLEVEAFSSAESFLAQPELAKRACVVTEVQLPGLGGLELQSELKSRGVDLPVIVLASRGDVATAVRALRAGAVDFIEKPFVDRVLTERIKEALARPSHRVS